MILKNIEYCKFYETLHRKFRTLDYQERKNRFNKDYPPTIWLEAIYNNTRELSVEIYFDCNKQFLFKLYNSARKDFDIGQESEIDIPNRVLYRALLYIGKGVEDTKAREIFRKNVQEDDWGDWEYEVDDLIKTFFQNHPPDMGKFQKNKDEAEKAAGLNKEKNVEILDKTNFGKVFEEPKKDKRKGKFLGIVPSRMDNFIGRTEELKHLYKAISETENIIFLHGMPGIGKTSLVKSFIGQYRFHFDHIAWLSISRAEGDLFDRQIQNPQFRLEQASMQLYIDLNGGKIDPNLTQTQRLKYTIGLLNTNDGNNLLVIDNYDQSILADRHNNKLPHNSNWKILVTGRYKVANLENITLDSLSLLEAKSLFRKFYDRTVDEDLLEQFLEEIDRHTLMIEIAAKSLNESNTVTLELLYQKLKRSQLDDPELDQIIGTEYSAEEGRLIKHLLCLFDIKSLSEEEIIILKTSYFIAAYSFKVELIPYISSIHEEHAKGVLLQLCRNGWLLYNSENKFYSLHRLIQKVIFYALSPVIDDVELLLSFYKSCLDEADHIVTLAELEPIFNYIISQAREVEFDSPLLKEFRYNLRINTERIEALFKNGLLGFMRNLWPDKNEE